MPPTEEAQRNHDELFPGHVSTLAVTDPELIEMLRQLRLRRGAAARRPRHPDPADGAARGDDRLPGRQRVPGHARRRADRRGDPGRGEGDRLPGRAVRGHGQGVRLPARHQRRAHRARRRAAAARPVDHHAARPARRRAWPCRSRSSARDGSTRMLRRRARTTSSTSSATCRPTASATTSPAPASTCRRASCSPSPCSSRSAAATPGQGPRRREPQRRQRPGPAARACSPSCCRSSATPARSTDCASLNEVTPAEPHEKEVP